MRTGQPVAIDNVKGPINPKFDLTTMGQLNYSIGEEDQNVFGSQLDRFTFMKCPVVIDS
jgi:hypothetical protein